jgi:hypothetical protein
MKADILEQLVDDYLKFSGFITVHNVKFQPRETDPEYIKRDNCVASDMDVVGFHPRREGADRVWVVSCKSWQDGLDSVARNAAIEANKIRYGGALWKRFRERVKKK